MSRMAFKMLCFVSKLKVLKIRNYFFATALKNKEGINKSKPQPQPHSKSQPKPHSQPKNIKSY